MDFVRYNSRIEEYKTPFGGIKTGEESTYKIHILNSLNPNRVSMVVRTDGEAHSTYYSMHKIGCIDDFDIFSCSLQFDTPDLYFYRFEIETCEGIKFVGLKDGVATIGDWLDEWQLTVYNSDFTIPDWIKGGIMYQIFPDRFCRSNRFSPIQAKNERKIHENWFETPDFIYNNPDYKANDYFCGNIDGIIEKLSYIKDLGVDIIYLNPVFESPEYHRYSTGNYLNIDPYLGTNEIFKTFVNKCKELGIKVILDGVFSHTGADSIYFNKYGNYDSNGAYNSTLSPYYDWYNFTEYPNEYESWWGFKNLPNVNETNPSYMEYITGENGVLSFWDKMGISGWRLDVADELPDEFIDNLYIRVKKLNKDSFIIGEVWEDATNKFAYNQRRRYLLGGQMDSVMNYPWRTAIIDFVKEGNETLFNDRIFSIMENYPPHVLQCLMNSISTHDTMRAITCFGVNHEIPDHEKGDYVMTHEEYEKGKFMLFQATFLQFTLPGIPSIYYGDEVGLYGFRDPYCRKTYPYGREDFSILEFYKSLAKVRQKFREDFTKPLKLYDMKSGLYAFCRGNLLCAINLGKEMNYFRAHDKKIIFEHGNNTLFDHGIDLMPNSMVILK